MLNKSVFCRREGSKKSKTALSKRKVEHSANFALFIESVNPKIINSRFNN